MEKVNNKKWRYDQTFSAFFVSLRLVHMDFPFWTESWKSKSNKPAKSISKDLGPQPLWFIKVATIRAKTGFWSIISQQALACTYFFLFYFEAYWHSFQHMKVLMCRLKSTEIFGIKNLWNSRFSWFQAMISRKVNIFRFWKKNKLFW